MDFERDIIFSLKKERLAQCCVDLKSDSLTEKDRLVLEFKRDELRSALGLYSKELHRKIDVIESEEDFLKIVPSLSHSRMDSIGTWALHVIEKHACDFEKLAKVASDLGEGFDYKCAPIYQNFDFDLMGVISLIDRRYVGCMNIDPYLFYSPGFFLSDGHHRCLSLACLLLEKKIKYQPVLFLDRTEIVKDFEERQARITALKNLGELPEDYV